MSAQIPYFYPPAHIGLAQLFNVEKTAETPFFDVDINHCELEETPKLIRIYVALNTQAILTLTRRVELVTVAEKLNGGAPLNAGCAYIFDSAVSLGEVINFTADADVTVLKVAVFWVV